MKIWHYVRASSVVSGCKISRRRAHRATASTK